MQRLSFEEIRTMKGNGSSMRMVLKAFLDKGAEVFLVHEEGQPVERYFLVKCEGVDIPLRAYKLNFVSSLNSFLSLTITADKVKSQALLEAFNLPVPATQLGTEQAEAFLARHKKLVVKPRRGSHGDGITTGVTSMEQLKTAVSTAQAQSPEVLLQQQIDGDDYRLLFVNYEFVAAVKRVPATLTGDGQRTIRQIIEDQNRQTTELWEQLRTGQVSDEEVRGSVSKIPLEEVVAVHGEEFLDQVPSAGKSVQVVDKANVSLGGQTHDVTDEVSAELTARISEFLKKVDLPLCGVDVLSTDITAVSTANTSYIIELNAAPGLRLHELPYAGQRRPVCALVADALLQRAKSLQK